MRLASFRDRAGTVRCGVVQESGVHAFDQGVTMTSIVGAGLEAAREAADAASRGEPFALDEVEWLPPLTPPSVRDFVAFEEHVEGVRRSVSGAAGVPEAWYDAPTFYFTNPHSLVGHESPVEFPASSVARDFELEVAAVVGRAGRSLTLPEAHDAIFGYTILNDWSARDLQSREMQVGLGPAKGKDFATSLGPWLVTADELDPFRDSEGFLQLECTVAVNGETIGRDLLSNMGWSFDSLVAYASRDSWVRPGDVLGSGTTGNGGCLAELWGRSGEQHPAPLEDGDVVSLVVEGLGTLTNRITSAAPGPALPAFRAPSRQRHLVA
ncbi:fumarylacetoacetate hydrolase family protein [Marmoricola sp. URHB0036]|uniref:fumarylacetoacetate hydrolase family protein n=1 Tax=Marmoricola sp. URHB0036 TaxID=1298863 RepID=UPI0003FB7563|nr:fumarylacetoacetate hydrolase family protein [Marmoricola sp. URHB0036]